MSYTQVPDKTNNRAPDPSIIELQTSRQFAPVDAAVSPATNPADSSKEALKTKPIFADQSTFNPDVVGTILDKDWVKQAFLVSDIRMPVDGFDVKNRYWTSAETKFTDTRLGGNIGINARPQFTWYSDIRVQGRLAEHQDVSVQNIGGRHGMGRYYSDAIDDNAQTIYLRFGVPQFNSLMGFFSKAFDRDMTSLARTGRSASAWHTVGEIAGTIAAVTAFPVLSGAMILGRLVSVLFSRPTSKFYRLKPTMHTYWSAVNMLANTIAINRGLIPRIFDDAENVQGIGNPYKLDKEYLSNLASLMPDMFTSDSITGGHGFDIFAVANKAQRIANALQHEDYERLNNGSRSDYIGYVQKAYTKGDITTIPKSGTLTSWINDVTKFGSYYTASDSDTRMEQFPKKDIIIGTDQQPLTPEQIQANDAAEKANRAQADTLGNFFDAEYRQGAQFAVFKVDHTGAVSEAFSNSVTESDLSQKFNGVSSSTREARFSLAEGNVTGSMVEDTIKGVLGAAGDVLRGALNGMTFNLFESLSGLAGNGFIDIPKHWQSSSVSLPRSSYTMQLISPYGNLISQMQNIFIPLSMIMAGVMPISTGKQSYTSPFLCQLFDRGRCQIQTGMIDSLSITRGTCNLPFNNHGQVLAIDVTFSITDMSSIMHMPLGSGSLFSANTAIDEDSILMDYLAVLAGQDLYSQIYTLPKAKLNLAKTINNFEKLTSPAYWAGLVHENTTTGMLGIIGNSFEALLPGAAIIPRS